MHFQFPEAWYLLPLLIIPFLINLQRYFNRHTVAIPSLFFLEKILRKKHRREIRLWELLAEFFFLLGLIFLLSRPIFSQPQLGHDRLLVLLDDSPSMHYHFLPTQNPFFESLKKMLEANRYEQIDIALLSGLSHKNYKEPYSFRKPEDIDHFYHLLPDYLNKKWSVEEVKEFFQAPEEQSRYRNYDFIVYSDNKENHFLNKGSKEILELPALLNAAILPPAPTLLNTELIQENFFTKENIELTITINPQSENELFALVTLDSETVFRKQVPPDKETAILTVKFPVVVSKEVEDSARKLTVGLEKDGVVFQKHTQIIHVYKPKILALVPPKHSTTEFFETLFAYDLERGNLAITPTPESADTFLILDTKINPDVIPSYRSRRLFFFLDPQMNTVRVNQILQKWGVNGFTVERKKKVGVFDNLELLFLKKFQTVSAAGLDFENYFTFDFFKVPDYAVVSIQKQPIIFRFENHAVFNGIGIEKMTSDIDPQHLVWIYELLFSLWGKKPVNYAYSQKKMTSHVSKSLEEFSSDQLSQNKKTSKTESVFTLFAPPIEEFISPFLDPEKSGWANIVKKVNTFPIVSPMVSKNTNSSSPESFLGVLSENFTENNGNVWNWISFVVILEMLLLTMLIYATIIRWKIN